jgi:hypothetical protein
MINDALLYNKKISQYRQLAEFLELENHIKKNTIRVKSAIKGTTGVKHYITVILLGVDCEGEKVYVGNNLTSKLLLPTSSIYIKTLPTLNSKRDKHFTLFNLLFREKHLDIEDYTPQQGSFVEFYKENLSLNLIANQFVTPEMRLYEPVNHLWLPNQRVIKYSCGTPLLYSTSTVKTTDLKGNLHKQGITLDSRLEQALNNTVYREAAILYMEDLTIFDKQLMLIESIVCADPSFFRGNVDWIEFNNGIDNDGT